MSNFSTPGVYVQEISKLPPSVAQVATAIPAFIGFTEKAMGPDGEDLDLVPTRISSLLEYETYYGKSDKEENINVKMEYVADTNSWSAMAELVGGASTKYTMWYNMQMFFANGGGPCYIVSVGEANFAQDTDSDSRYEDLKDGLDEAAKVDEITLLVFPDAVNTLSGAESANFATLQVDALNQCGSLQDRFAILDVLENSIDVGIPAFRTGVGTNNLKYGAAYFPFLQTSLNYDYDESAVSTDITYTGVTGGEMADVADVENLGGLAGNELYDQGYNAAKDAIKKLRVELNPSSTIAGIYAYVDRTRGVWKAPANISLNRVIKPTITIDNELQKDLNITGSGKSVNAIRSFTGKGVLVWGARTLKGNDAEWRYVSVRRFFNMVEESIQESTEFAVFEPNDANTWIKIKGMIENYLTNLWKQGALAGSKPDQAFFVNVGLGTTMTAQDILNGYMNVEIGMAAVRPAEFIVLKFSHKLQEA